MAVNVEHFQARVVQDALAQGTAAYWNRRALTFEQARPKPTDWLGRATVEDVLARDRRLCVTAQACRNKALVALLDVGSDAP